MTILLTNFSLHKITAFISDKIKANTKKQTFGEPGVALVRRRDREFYDSVHRDLPASGDAVRYGHSAHTIRWDRRISPENLNRPIEATCTVREGKPLAFWTIRRALKGPESPVRQPNAANGRSRFAQQHPFKQEIAPEKSQERFLFVPTGRFREEFRERPKCGLFT
ncbi:hypothetical protein [Cryobacterium sp. Y11]|uniref:hypothetical protein n=1 Tax=Cryobacterium sp. Y11 TaxID=2045016 RepID=UPI000CE483B3|nr:hypothetical protein [Cryobacterium sp. Y11]